MMTSKILHIAKDEKFIDSAINQFGSLNFIDNDFFILNECSELNYIKQKEKVNCFKTSSYIINKLNQYRIIFFHSLDADFIPIVLSTNKNQTCIWMCFGYEVYNDSFYVDKKNLYAELTLKHTTFTPVSIQKKLKNYLRPIKRIIYRDTPFTPQELKIKAIRRMDYLVSSYKEEYSKISGYIHQKKKQLDFTYYPLEYIVNVNDLEIKTTNQILVGNSGTLTNNHLDVFKKIYYENLNNYTILCPLSYGDKVYIEKIKIKGKFYFKDYFSPITNFLPLEDYNQLIRTSSIAIFYNFRQQAIGNIIASLWYGAKVFLSKKNSFFSLLKSNGIIVFDFDKSNLNVYEPLNINQITHNRLILKNLFSEKRLLEKLSSEIDNLIK
ncbi:TDP-N-acetylfucosamine:lipid II N-acetylfucosaminyltransferase [Aurantibacter aestuarii]|uniref:4-alpha-L-fucosyltransferase n=1 Tax=Aurantibacter aestuarii TaxID=1266046 RepID=A0A2T1N5T6_9FLAO|nr:TDP-N-acetylfucosamine:lipid II N-acetylfucosaminyltransferase [Aurantibacter aestuarii]PSG86516.1 hypothetical protein C7H52_12595 [Aurantibacter aestuarii]